MGQTESGYSRTPASFCSLGDGSSVRPGPARGPGPDGAPVAQRAEGGGRSGVPRLGLPHGRPVQGAQQALRLLPAVEEQGQGSARADQGPLRVLFFLFRQRGRRRGRRQFGSRLWIGRAVVDAVAGERLAGTRAVWAGDVATGRVDGGRAHVLLGVVGSGGPSILGVGAYVWNHQAPVPRPLQRKGHVQFSWHLQLLLWLPRRRLRPDWRKRVVGGIIIVRRRGRR
mmetsp:Transcript_4407/g.13033  ORF Transcript_4407/g.13033 Transcript_4407/m.13033 type:complete len:226 (+) Transcript_4407:556-1233(+)